MPRFRIHVPIRILWEGYHDAEFDVEADNKHLAQEAAWRMLDDFRSTETFQQAEVSDLVQAMRETGNCDLLSMSGDVDWWYAGAQVLEGLTVKDAE